MSINTTFIVPFSFGVVAGTILSTAYFMHLARQIRMLCNNRSDEFGLLLGAVLRMSVLLANGWLLFAVLGPLSAVGYGFAFMLVRTLAIQRTRREVLSCN